MALAINNIFKEGRIKMSKKHDLIYEDFKEYEIIINDYDWFKDYSESFCHRFRFKNGYGASVIKHYESYGYEDDLFELAVLKFDDENDFDLCYDTPITDDVVGYLTNDEVLKLLEQIEKIEEK